MSPVNIVVYEGELKKAYETPAGYDLPSLSVKEATDISISDFTKIKIATGIKLQMPSSLFAIVKPRSSAMPKHNIQVIDGTIDADYRGEIFISAIVHETILEGLLQSEVNNQPLPSVAQIVFFEKPTIRLVNGKVDNNTLRGDRGFGSSDN